METGPMDILMILLAALAGGWLGRRLPRRTPCQPWHPPMPRGDIAQDYGPCEVVQVARPGRIYLRSPP